MPSSTTTWDELVALSAADAALGVPLHVDGARLWESQPFYDRPLSEIAALADSGYVSFYKGLRDRLPLMGEYVAWSPAFAEGDPDVLELRLVEFLERERVQPCQGWRPSEVPGMAKTEVTVHSAALKHDPGQVAQWYAQLVEPGS